MTHLNHLIRYGASDGSFYFSHSKDDYPDPSNYNLHYEMGYEIYMFISGEGSYNIEGIRYELEPYSILMMNSNELHALQLSSHSCYERIVLTFQKDFLPPFLSHGVDFLRTIKFRKLGHGNQIKADIVRQSGMLGLFEKLQELLGKPNAENEFLAKCLIVQILGTINLIKENEQLFAPTPKPTMGKVNDLLEYINSNLNEPLNLDSLSEKFYLTKYHLCRIFKEATGYSINQYISYKRIHLADSLMLEGYTPTQACFMSGFNSYSSFYKSYRKLKGKSPRGSNE